MTIIYLLFTLSQPVSKTPGTPTRPPIVNPCSNPIKCPGYVRMPPNGPGRGPHK
jgi:hypothetical protein